MFHSNKIRLIIYAVSFVVIGWLLFWAGFQKGLLVGLKSEHEALSYNIARMIALQKQIDPEQTNINKLVHEEIVFSHKQITNNELLIDKSTISNILLETPTKGWGYLVMSRRDVESIDSKLKKYLMKYNRNYSETE